MSQQISYLTVIMVHALTHTHKITCTQHCFTHTHTHTMMSYWGYYYTAAITVVYLHEKILKVNWVIATEITLVTVGLTRAYELL